MKRLGLVYLPRWKPPAGPSAADSAQGNNLFAETLVCA